MNARDFKSVHQEISVLMRSCEETDQGDYVVSEVPLIFATPDDGMTRLDIKGLGSGDCVVHYSDKKKCASDLKKLKRLGCV